MSGSTSSGNGFAQQIENYVSQDSSGSVASISAQAATYGSKLAMSYVSAGLQNLEGFLGGLSSSGSGNSSPSSSASGFNLANLIQQGISQFVPQISSSGSGSSSSGSGSSGSLSSLIGAGVQENLPAGVGMNGSTFNFPAIPTPFGSFSASLQNGALSVTPSSGS